MIEAPAVPGPAIRAYRGDADLPGMLRSYSAAHEADGVEEVTTLDDIRRNYATLVNCDPARDIFVAEVEGEVVAYARVFWQELVEGGRSYENFGFVHPAWRRRGIGGELHRRASLGVDTDSPTGATDLYRSLGFVPERTFTAWRKPL